MKKSFFLLLLISVVSSKNVCACDCAPPGPPQVEFEEAEVVFVGKMIDLIDNDEVTFSVIKNYKGVSQPSISITDNGSSMCGYTFEHGKNYLVYASRFEGKLETGVCDRTAEFSADLEDLKFLDHIVETSTQ